MSQVRKHPLPTERTTVRLPEGSLFLTAGSYVKRGQVQPVHALWTEEPSGANVPMEEWVIVTAMTGDYPGDGLKHLASHIGVGAAGESYVTHFYLALRRLV